MTAAAACGALQTCPMMQTVSVSLKLKVLDDAGNLACLPFIAFLIFNDIARRPQYALAEPVGWKIVNFSFSKRIFLHFCESRENRFFLFFALITEHESILCHSPKSGMSNYENFIFSL